MAEAVVEIRGVDAVIRALDAKKSRAKLKRAVVIATSVVGNTAKSLCPVDTGHLRGSIHMRVQENGADIVGRVYSNCEYAQFVEFGTGIRGDGSVDDEVREKVKLAYKPDWAGQQAQPFMYSALKQNEAKVKRIIAEAAKG